MGFNITYEKVIGEPNSELTTIHPVISSLQKYISGGHEWGEFVPLNGLLYSGDLASAPVQNDSVQIYNTGDPFRSNLLLFWGFDQAEAPYAAEYFNSLGNSLYDTCTSTVLYCKPGYNAKLSKEYGDEGFNITLTPMEAGNSEQSIKKQTILFSMDTTSYETPWGTLNKDIDADKQKFLEYVASLFTEPGSKPDGPFSGNKVTARELLLTNIKSLSSQLQFEPLLFVDVSFDSPLPISKTVADFMNTTPLTQGQFGAGGGVAEIKPVYNFFIKVYEDAMAKHGALIPHHALPNIYSFFYYSLNDKSLSDLSPMVWNMTLQGEIPEELVAAAISVPTEKGQDQTNDPPPGTSTVQYFDLFGKTLKNLPGLTEGRFGAAKSQFNHIFFSPDSLKTMKTANQHKTAFPMYVDIKFDSLTGGEFCQLLHDTDNTLSLMKSFAMAWFGKKAGQNISMHPGMGNNVAQTDWSLAPPFRMATAISWPPGYPGVKPLDALIGDANSLPIINMDKWFYYQAKVDESFPVTDFTAGFTMQQYFSKAFEIPNAPQGAFFEAQSQIVSADPIINFKNQWMQLVFAAKLAQLKEKYFHTYAKKIAGVKAYSETVFYRIQKILEDPNSGQLALQNFWIPNMPGHDVVNYVDTQVKYGEKYIYKIYAYNIVFGSSYAYITPQPEPEVDTPPTTDDECEHVDGTTQHCPPISLGGMLNTSNLSVGEADVVATYVTEDESQICSWMDVISRPYNVLVEVPYYEKSALIVDSPPFPPTVEIKPYSKISNRIKIDLYSQTGDRDMEPIPINISDVEEFDKIRQSQNRNLTDADGDFIIPTIRFKADDYAAEYQIFRINFKPTSYKDFSGLPTVINAETATAINDMILSNRKYYYMFRTVDIHGHISNPSVVYEVEIVKEGDMFFLLSDTIDLEEKPKPLVPTKPMKRFLSLTPAYQQTVMNKLILDNVAHDSVDDLGLADGVNIFGDGEMESVFEDKIFKIRLTSKSTGRKLDLNVKYKIEYEKTKKEYL